MEVTNGEGLFPILGWSSRFVFGLLCFISGGVLEMDKVAWWKVDDGSTALC